MITYNFYCLNDNKCVNYSKMIHITMPEESKQNCDKCGNELKLVGQKCSTMHVGTQEHQNKVDKYNSET